MKNIFESFRKAAFSKKNRFFGFLFLTLLILGLISVGVLINLRSDLRQQAAVTVYGECIYWSQGSCPNGYVAATCTPVCSTGGACCTAVAPTSVPVVTPTPTEGMERSPCLNFDKKTGLCSGFAYGT